MSRFSIYAALTSGILALLASVSATAHHSYAMFDMSKSAIVQGSVAKMEWVNPHVFVWVYVRKPGKPSEYDLYAFENGPINMMTRHGWNKTALKQGDQLTVLYFPLRDGRKGGYFVRGVRPDSSHLDGDPQAPGVMKELAKGTLIEAPKP